MKVEKQRSDSFYATGRNFVFAPKPTVMIKCPFWKHHSGVEEGKPGSRRQVRKLAGDDGWTRRKVHGLES